MITVSSPGSFKKTTDFLNKMIRGDHFRVLDRGGRRGVDALSAATPIDTGETAQSWYYEIEKGRGSYTITWYNRHEDGGAPVAILIQYGHGTGTGGFVQGRDFINPAMKPVFDKILDDVWREVRNG